MNYENAFNCKNCPGRNDNQGCPVWADPWLETNLQTGEEKILQGCFLPHLPRWFTLVIQASNRPAAAFESARNEIVKAVNQVADKQQKYLEMRGNG